MENVREAAVESAVQTVNQFKLIRGYYTRNVIRKALGTGNLRPSIDHAQDPDAIPLPATFIHDVSRELENQATSLSLYSAFPFPNRSARVLDPFQQEAWEFLTANPDEVFSRQETRDGNQVVRVAVADRMAAEGCVTCHNSHPDTPKNDWRLGDVRGILEVDTVIDPQIAAGQALSEKILLAAAGAGLLLMAIFAAGGVAVRRVTRPIAQMSQAMVQLSDGDLSVDVPGLDRTDEVGRLARSVQVFRENARQRESFEREQASAQSATDLRTKAVETSIQAFDGKVAGILQTVTDAAGALESTATNLSDNAEATGRRAIAVTTASEQTSGNIQTVAAASQELMTSIGEIGHQAEQSSSISNEAVEVAARANTNVSELSVMASNISNVVDLISDIAEQTNLLALNATIEAARAGEAGKGFAVVANEVKSLATQTAKATEEIAQQVTAMQSATEGTVGAIAEIGKVIESIKSIAGNIGAGVEEQSSATGEISRSVQEAASGVTQVSENIADVTTAAGETDAAARHVLDAVAELAKQSNALRAEIDQFLTDVRTA